MWVISWVKAAQKDFTKFPLEARQKTIRAKIAAEGQKADIAQPMKGLGPEVYEIMLRHESSAYRVVYAVHFGPRRKPAPPPQREVSPKTNRQG